MKRKLLALFTTTLVILTNSSVAQSYIDYKIRYDDLYARVLNDELLEGSSAEEVVWKFKAGVAASSASVSYSSVQTKSSSGTYDAGKWLLLSLSEFKSGKCLDNADNVYVFIEGWEEDGGNTTFGTGDDDYRSDTDYDLNLSGNPRNTWTNFNSNDNSGDYANAGTVGATNGDYRVEIDTWWNWSLPVNPAFTLTNLTADSFVIDFGSTNNYRVTSWTYQVSTVSNFSTIHSTGTVTANETVTGLDGATTYYVRILGSNEAGSGSYTTAKTATTGKVIYVNHLASGANNGTSWTDAYTSLQTALENVVATDDIWVAKGTYKPSSNNGAYTLADGRDFHFSLIDNIRVYGGFAGTETEVGQRVDFGKAGVNRTVLNGEIGLDELSNPIYAVHVIYLGDTVSTNTVLDGFVVEKGYADESVAFHNNYGGGVYIGTDAHLTINNCVIRNNYAFSSGGAIYNKGHLIIKNSSFLYNSTSNSGGAIFSNSGDTLETINSLFYQNTAGYGGGIYNIMSTCIVTNCTFSDNTGNNYAGAIENVGEGAVLTAKNSIFWGNSSLGTGANQQIYNNATATFSNCDIQGSGGSASWNATDLGTDGGNNIDTDPLFETATDEYRLYGVSPCVDVGDDSANSLLTDIRGSGFGRKLNKLDGTAGTIDMGAYEYKFATDPYGYGSVTTDTVTSIQTTTATVSGNITNLGAGSVTAHGICWSTSTGPTVADNKTNEGVGTEGVFSSNLTGLVENTTYYVRSYVTNVAGTSYGNELTFSSDTYTPAIGIKFKQNSKELSWTVEEEVAVKEYQIIDSHGNVILTTMANGSGFYTETLDTDEPVAIQVVDVSGYTQTFNPEDGNVQITIYDLQEGWNLIAITSENADLSQMISATTGNIWSWNGDVYKSTTTVPATQAIWVYSPAAKQVSVTGTKSSATISLKNGWNMVGPVENCRTPEGAEVIYSWTDIYNEITTENETLIEGVGYWIFSITD